MSQALAQKIFIPKTCEYTQALRVLVDPPSSEMTIQLCDTTGAPFQEGKVSKRGNELAIFMFRPQKLIIDEVAGEVKSQTHLKQGDQVLVKVLVIDKTNLEHKREQLVTVT